MNRKNDGQGINAIQNKFTAFLKTSLRNRKIDYWNAKNGKKIILIPLEEVVCNLIDEYDFHQQIIDYSVVDTALEILSQREREIIITHILEDKEFGEIGKKLNLTYKGTATVYYRAVKKLKNDFEEDTNEL